MKIYQIIILVTVALLLASCSNNTVVGPNTTNPSPQTSTMDPQYATDWMYLMYSMVANQDISPPKAARIYCYASITVYESVVNGMPNYRSLSGQLNEMPAMPSAGMTVYDWPSVIAGSLPDVIRGLLDTPYVSVTQTAITNCQNTQIAERKTVVDSAIVNRSVTYGQSIAAAILAWAHTDQYTETRSMIYTVPSRIGHPSNWAPTDPVHLKPLEPFWGLLRPFAMSNGHSCDVPMNKLFDTAAGTPFYNDAVETQTTVTNLTLDQQNIALYWQDKVRTGTPAGHWISIMNQICGQNHLKLDKAAEMYALVSIAMADAFISCWAVKYKVENNLLRPYTYIRQYIPGGSNWETFLATPPFPEYTSGHSTQSAAAAEVLTNLFGSSYAFTDTTLFNQGYSNRTFNSFYAARDEAAISRLYGGIHFRQAIENGKTEGALVGQTVINRVKTRIN